MYKIVSILVIAMVLSACTTTPVSEPSTADFQTQIRWTTYGIPHVKVSEASTRIPAQFYGGVGFRGFWMTRIPAQFFGALGFVDSR